MTTESMPNQKVTELIKRCLALSQSSNEHEASLAMAKAQELLEKYNLDIDSFYVSGEKPVVHINLPLDDFGDKWKRQLMYSIALENFCEGVRIGDTLHILGRPENVIATTDMGYWLIEQIEMMSLTEVAHYTGTINKRTYRNSWLLGCVNTVVGRVKALRNDRVASSKELYTLVLRLDTETQDYLSEQYPSLRHTSSRSHVSYEAYNNGQRAGSTVGLFRQRKVEGNGHLLS